MSEPELVKVLVDLGNLAFARGLTEDDFKKVCREIADGDVRIYD